MNREVELGSYSQMVCLTIELFLNSCFLDMSFLRVLCTAGETAISEVPKLLRTGGVPT